MTTKSNWHAFGKKANSDNGGKTSTPVTTMNLRCVIHKDGRQVIEQMIEYRDSNGLIAGTDWVAIPVIYEQEN